MHDNKCKCHSASLSDNNNRITRNDKQFINPIIQYHTGLSLMDSCGLVQNVSSQSDSFMKIILAALQEKTNITCGKQIIIIEVMVRV